MAAARWPKKKFKEWVAESPAYSSLPEKVKHHSKAHSSGGGKEVAKKPKYWMKKEAAREEKAGTEGALGAWFKANKPGCLDAEGHIKTSCLTAVISRLSAKAKAGKLSPTEIKLFRRCQMAMRYREAK